MIRYGIWAIAILLEIGRDSAFSHNVTDRIIKNSTQNDKFYAPEHPLRSELGRVQVQQVKVFYLYFNLPFHNYTCPCTCTRT